jgi:hypothetical protein
MIDRYVSDLWKMIAETVRVLKPSGQATFVVGNSCLKGIFIRNADAVAKAAELLGLNLVKSYERELPNRNRYLPITTSGSLGKRMRTETILTFAA